MTVRRPAGGKGCYRMSQFVLSGFGDEIAEDLSTQLSVMKENHIHCLEIRSVNGKPIVEHTPAEAKKIKEQLDAAGFRVSSLGSPIGKIGIRDDFRKHLELFRRALEIAKILDAPFFRLFSFYIPEGEKPEKYRGEVMERMDRLCAEAKGFGVRLLHENELGIYGDTPERCLDLMETLGYDRIGAVFDPANFINLKQRVEIYPYAWHLLKKYVDYMHIKDAVHVSDPLHNHHEIRPAGYGDGRIADILRELEESGYRGFLSVEPHLGSFSGFEKLERRIVDETMPKGGPKTFTVAARALQDLIAQVEKGKSEKQ